MRVGVEAPGGRRILAGVGDFAKLITEARERQEITVEQLGIRSGLSPALLLDAEAGRVQLTLEQLSDVLLVCGLQLERSPRTGRLAVRALELDVDPAELEYQRSLSMSERLGGAIGWNTFADRLYQAGQRARS